MTSKHVNHYKCFQESKPRISIANKQLKQQKTKAKLDYVLHIMLHYF